MPAGANWSWNLNALLSFLGLKTQMAGGDLGSADREPSDMPPDGTWLLSLVF